MTIRPDRPAVPAPKEPLIRTRQEAEEGGDYQTKSTPQGGGYGGRGAVGPAPPPAEEEEEPLIRVDDDEEADGPYSKKSTPQGGGYGVRSGAPGAIDTEDKVELSKPADTSKK
jgi:hypothetical protein